MVSIADDGDSVTIPDMADVSVANKSVFCSSKGQTISVTMESNSNKTDLGFNATAKLVQRSDKFSFFL